MPCPLGAQILVTISVYLHGLFWPRLKLLMVVAVLQNEDDRLTINGDIIDESIDDCGG